MTEKNLTTSAPTIKEQRKAKFDQFKILWASTAKLNSTMYAEPDENDVSMAFADLSAYSIEEIKTALAKFRKMPERRLTPAIIESIITGISWLTPSEAWAIAQKTFDDGVSVILTNEIAEAAGHAEKLYLSGQKNAAKDDFVGVYNRLMLDAVAKGKKPRWFLRQADNCVNRTAENKRAIVETFQNGYISQKWATEMAESLGIEYTGGLKNLITRAPDDETRQKLQGLKQLFVGDKNVG